MRRRITVLRDPSSLHPRDLGLSLVVRMAALLFTVLHLAACEDFKKAIKGQDNSNGEAGSATQKPSSQAEITALKNYRLHAEVSEYREGADACFPIKHHSDRVEVCTYDDTLAHQDYQFWLYFIDGALGRIEARPLRIMYPNNVSAIVAALEERFGAVEDDYGFLVWRGAETTLRTRIRHPRTAVVTLADNKLDKLLDSQRTEDPTDDI